MSIHRLGAELPLINLTLWLQSAGIAALVAWVRRALAGDTARNERPSFRRVGFAIDDGGCRSTRIGDSAVGRILSLALLAVVGLGDLFLGEQLFDPRV